jgi:adenylosuccinate lyase
VTLYGLRKAADLAGGLRVFPEAVELNVMNAGDRYFSQSVMLALVRHGSTREDSYAVVQRIAMAAMEKGTSFAEAVLADPQVAGLVPEDELSNICTIDNHLRNEGYLLNRIGLD